MLNDREKWYVSNNYYANATSFYWDRQTQNGSHPDRMSLQQAKAVVNDYMKELGFDRSQLRK